MRCCYLSFGVLFLPKKVNSTLFHINRHQINPQTSHLSGTSAGFKKEKLTLECNVAVSNYLTLFCSKCCLVLCPFRVQSLGKYTSLPWWYGRGCWSQKRAVYNCVFVDFFNVNKPSNGAFKIEPFVRRLRGVRELS